MTAKADVRRTGILAHADLHLLFETLAKRGFLIVGPTVRDGAIVYDELASPDDLPLGWTDRQENGTYRLERRKDGACFGYTVGPHSWKKFLHPAAHVLWEAARKGSGYEVVAAKEDPPRYAFVGVRACELHAIGIQDRVLTRGQYADVHYSARRKNALIVAVNCSKAGGTCFCASMECGPKVGAGFDLALTEIIAKKRHEFFVEAGSGRGGEILAELPVREAAGEDAAAAAAVVAGTAAKMGRRMDTRKLKELLQSNPESACWDEVGERCLSCASCTMVCPTCFCTTIEDVTDLTGARAERRRRWDSCFTKDFSYIHGGSIRTRTATHYRHWLTHKLANWVDQFESSGCVGCGRCITWCPAGIDITEEVRAIRKRAGRGKERGDG